MAWATPAAPAAWARLAAWVTSRSASKCSKNDVRQNAPYAPSKALTRLSTSSRSARTTVAPWSASARAAAESGVRVIARQAKPPSGSARMARARPPPVAPAAPTTAMVLVSVILVSVMPPDARRRRDGSASTDLLSRPTQFPAPRPQRDLTPVREVQLVQDVLDVVLRSALGQEQPRRDLAVRQTSRNEVRNLELARRQCHHGIGV